MAAIIINIIVLNIKTIVIFCMFSSRSFTRGWSYTTSSTILIISISFFLFFRLIALTNTELKLISIASRRGLYPKNSIKSSPISFIYFSAASSLGIKFVDLVAGSSCIFFSNYIINE